MKLASPASDSARFATLPEAQGDLDELYDWILTQAGERTADGYVARLREACGKLDLFPLRGNARPDLGEGLRLLGFERRATIAFHVEDHAVRIVRILYGGQDVEAILSGRDP